MSGVSGVCGCHVVCVCGVDGRSSEYLWEMDNGEMHHIPESEGGEQGDPMMLLWYSLGQYGALEAANVNDVRTTSSAQCPQTPLPILLRPTMQVRGDVCAPRSGGAKQHPPLSLGGVGLRVELGGL